MIRKAILVAPPRLYWPFLNEGDNFLLPQWMVCLAAVLRENDVETRCLDCMASKVGWRSLEEELKAYEPDLIGIGESHALYADEAYRFIRLARRVCPRSTIVAGGMHFTALAGKALEELPLDFVVRGEGELTLVDLVRELSRSKPDPTKVPGLALRRGGSVEISRPRELIEELDSLPMPAYDLVPMEQYGRGRLLFSPGGTTIHHSRGCNSSCKFCSWWTQMARRETLPGGGERLRPRWRTKSPARTVSEMELLRSNYGKECFVFVDDSWNIDGSWGRSFAREVKGRGLDVNWFAFMRADCIVRDEREGVLAELVESGLSHLCIGVERPSDADLESFGKPFYTVQTSRECFDILRRRYPRVFRQATFIVGARNETPESLEAMVRLAKELRADYPAFHPLTPVPGTALHEEARRLGWIEEEDFTKYDWNTPILSMERMSREDLAEAMYRMNRSMVSLPWLLKGLFSPYRYRRRMYLWWSMVMARVVWREVAERSRLPLKNTDFTALVKPGWYDG